MSIERAVLIRLKMAVGKDGRKAVRSLGLSVGGLQDAFFAVGKTAVQAGAVIAAGLAKATLDAREFGAAMAEVDTITRGNSGQFETMNKELLQLSRETGKAPVELAKALYQAASAGIESGDAIAFVARATKAAIGGVASAEEAVDLFTTVLNAYRMEASETGRVADIVFKTVEKGKTTFPELAAGMGDVLPFSAQLNVSLEDTFAAVAALTKGGIRTANATTFLKNVFAAILKPTSDAAEAARKYGIDLSASAVQAKGFLPFLQEIREKTTGNSEALAELFPSIRGLTAVLSLAGNQSAEFAAIQDALTHSLGASDEAFRTVSTSAAHEFDKALNDLKVTGIEIGREILPDAAAALGEIAGWFRELSDSKEFAEGLDIAKHAILAIHEIVTLTVSALKEMWDRMGGKGIEWIGDKIGDAAVWFAGAKTEDVATIQDRLDFRQQYEDRRATRSAGRDLAAAMNQAADRREQQIRDGIRVGLQNQSALAPAL